MPSAIRATKRVNEAIRYADRLARPGTSVKGPVALGRSINKKPYFNIEINDTDIVVSDAICNIFYNNGFKQNIDASTTLNSASFTGDAYLFAITKDLNNIDLILYGSDILTMVHMGPLLIAKFSFSNGTPELTEKYVSGYQIETLYPIIGISNDTTKMGECLIDLSGDLYSFPRINFRLPQPYAMEAIFDTFSGSLTKVETYSRSLVNSISIDASSVNTGVIGFYKKFDKTWNLGTNGTILSGPADEVSISEIVYPMAEWLYTDISSNQIADYPLVHGIQAIQANLATLTLIRDVTA